VRIRGLDLRDSGDVAAWWVGAGEYRAVVQLSANQRVALMARMRERFPGASRHEESLQASIGALMSPGAAVVVQASGFDQWIGLVRPFALGEFDERDVILTAIVRRGALSLPLLTCDPAAAEAYEQAFDTRAGHAQPLAAAHRGTWRPRATRRRGAWRRPTAAHRSRASDDRRDRARARRPSAHDRSAHRPKSGATRVLNTR
jgi:hypothetical protein